MQPKKIIKSLSELPTMPSTIGTMAWNQTGDWRYLTPLVASRPAPCKQNCPAGIPIPDYLSALNQGDFRGALSVLLAYNPLPGLTGLLCYHPCQTNCTRKKIDGAISIQEIERFMGELAVDAANQENKETIGRVTVIGSGPLGLSCAFYLGCWGLRVTVLDARKRPGGPLADLPSKILNPQVLENEIGRLIRLAGIHLESGAVFDFKKPGGSLSDADLVVLDPTGLPEPSSAPGGAVAFDPLVDEEACGDVLFVTLPDNLKAFKAPMIAHYIAAGRRTAEKLLGRLIQSPGRDIGEPTPELFLQTRNVEEAQTADSSTSVPSIGKKTKHGGTWSRERVVAEAARCLGCGTCNLCLQCISSCPEACIRLDDCGIGVTLDLDFCKGCGICAYECPRGVITMEEAGE